MCVGKEQMIKEREATSDPEPFMVRISSTLSQGGNRPVTSMTSLDVGHKPKTQRERVSFSFSFAKLVTTNCQCIFLLT